MEQAKRIKDFFALVLFVFLFGFIYKSYVVLYAGFSMGMLGLFSDRFVAITSMFWKHVSKYLGLITGTVILAIIYFLILTPAAFFYKIFNKDVLQLKPTASVSQFTTRNQTYTPKDLENPW